MRILHLISFYVPAYNTGGPVLSVHGLNKYLVKRGVDVTVYTTNISGRGTLDVPLGQPVTVDGVHVSYFPYSFVRGGEYSGELRRVLRETIARFDIVHVTGVFRATPLLGGYYARRYGKPYLISPRGSLMGETLAHRALRKKAYLWLVERRNLARAGAIHFTTPLEMEEYEQEKLPLRKAFIIPNGLDVKEFGIRIPPGTFREKFRIAADRRIVLFLSRINWKKGLDTLIPAFAEIVKKEPKAILVIAGGDDEGYGTKVKMQVARCKLQDKVIFTGMLVGEDKVAAYHAADVFVLPSYAENFGMVVAEAMACGVPVVITPRVGLAPYVQEAGAGVVVEKDVAAVTSAIIRILGDSLSARAMGEAGRKLVVERFSMESVADAFLEAYNTLIREGTQNAERV
jgi:glycosyltransferase involved in cell wall biosynthesis